MDGSIRRGAEHLIYVPDREGAETVAAELSRDGFADVRVVRTSEEGEAGQEWVVRLRDDRLPEATGAAAYEALRERFTATAHQHGGRYDEPQDPRPPE